MGVSGFGGFGFWAKFRGFKGGEGLSNPEWALNLKSPTPPTLIQAKYDSGDPMTQTWENPKSRSPLGNDPIVVRATIWGFDFLDFFRGLGSFPGPRGLVLVGIGMGSLAPLSPSTCKPKPQNQT